MKNKAFKSLTPDQLENRFAVLERINGMAQENANRHRDHMTRIGAMTRAIVCTKTSVEDRTALIAALEQIADTLALEAELDVEQLRYVNETQGIHSGDEEDELLREVATATKH